MKRQFVLGAAAGASLALTTALGAVTIPHIFEKNQVASAEQVNANFGVLQDALNALIPRQVEAELRSQPGWIIAYFQQGISSKAQATKECQDILIFTDSNELHIDSADATYTCPDGVVSELAEQCAIAGASCRYSYEVVDNKILTITAQRSCSSDTCRAAQGGLDMAYLHPATPFIILEFSSRRAILSSSGRPLQLYSACWANC